MLPETFTGFATDEVADEQNAISQYGEEQVIYVNMGFIWYLCCYPLPLVNAGPLLDLILEGEHMFFDHKDKRYIIAIEVERLSPPYLSNLNEAMPDVWAHWWAWKKGFEPYPEALCGQPCPYESKCEHCEDYWNRMEFEGYIRNGRYTKRWYHEQQLLKGVEWT